MSSFVMNKCWLLQMTPVQKSVLISLADNASDEGFCWPSIKTICKRTCLSERSVQRAINYLEEQKLIVRDLRYRRSTVYQFNLYYLDKLNKEIEKSKTKYPVIVTGDRVTGATETPITPSESRINPVTQTPRIIIEPSGESSSIVDDETIDQPEDNFDEEIKPNLDQPKKTIRQNIPYQKIVELYELILPELPVVNILNDTRKSHIRARWNEHPNHQSLEFWKDFFEYVRSSDFLMGKAYPKDGGRPFRANIDWLLKPVNFAKVTEGNYV